MAVLTTQYLNDDFVLYNEAIWHLLVEPNNISVISITKSILNCYHQIGFVKPIQPSDINNIAGLAIRAGVQNLHFHYYIENYTLVPSELYNFNQKENYINFLFGKHDNWMVKSDLNFNTNAYLVSGIDEELFRSMMVGIAKTSVNNWHNSMLNFTSKYKNHEDVAFVSCLNNSFTITINQGGIFTYINSFPYTKPEEICYKLLHAFSVYNLSSETCKVLVMGNINTDSFLFIELKKFFKDLECINFSRFPYQLIHQLSIPEHQIFPVLIATL
jgi:hypothetical protein